MDAVLVVQLMEPPLTPLLLCLQHPRMPSSASSYPFSVLGLGDVVVPGIFLGLLGQLDRNLNPAKVRAEGALMLNPRRSGVLALQSWNC
jgi:hypothetical protein